MEENYLPSNFVIPAFVMVGGIVERPVAVGRTRASATDWKAWGARWPSDRPAHPGLHPYTLAAPWACSGVVGASGCSTPVARQWRGRCCCSSSALEVLLLMVHRHEPHLARLVLGGALGPTIRPTAQTWRRRSAGLVRQVFTGTALFFNAAWCLMGLHADGRADGPFPRNLLYQFWLHATDFPELGWNRIRLQTRRRAIAFITARNTSILTPTSAGRAEICSIAGFGSYIGPEARRCALRLRPDLDSTVVAHIMVSTSSLGDRAFSKTCGPAGASLRGNVSGMYLLPRRAGPVARGLTDLRGSPAGPV